MLQAAIIGVGQIAETAHLPAWKQQENAFVGWLVDVDETRARQMAEQWGIPNWTTSFDDVLNNADVTLIDICSPAKVQTSLARKALNEHKHVLVEKPAVLNTEQLKQLRTAQRTSGSVLMVAENWLFSSAYRQIQSVYHDIGAPLIFMGFQESDYRQRIQVGNGDRGDIGFLQAAGVHSISLCNALVQSRATHVSALARPASSEIHNAPESDLIVTIKYHNDVLATCSFTSRLEVSTSRRLGFRLVGTHGTIDGDIRQGWVDLKATDVPELPQMPFSMGYAEEIRHFIDCVLNNRQPLTALKQQEQVLKIVLAAYDSVQTGQTISLAHNEDA